MILWLGKQYGVDLKQIFYICMFALVAVAPLLLVVSLGAILFASSSWMVWLVAAVSAASLMWWHIVKGDRNASSLSRRLR